MSWSFMNVGQRTEENGSGSQPLAFKSGIPNWSINIFEKANFYVPASQDCLVALDDRGGIVINGSYLQAI